MARRRTRPGKAATSWGAVLRWSAVVAALAGVSWIWWKAAYAPAPERAPAQGQARAPAATGQEGRAGPVVPEPPSRSETAPALLPTNPPPAVLPGPSSVSPAQQTWMPERPGEAARPAVPTTVERLVAAQLALARRGISSGSVDGVMGSQTRAALRAFQRLEGLTPTGQLDAETWFRLRVQGSPFTTYEVTAADLDRLTPVPRTWFGKSTRERLDYETVLELVAEKSHAHPRLIRQLNPRVDWMRVQAGTRVRVPDATLPEAAGKAAFVRIHLGEKVLRAYDGRSNLLVQFPCSIARQVEKRPVGRLQVARLAPDPNYRFDPEIFRESEEARRIGRRLMIPPGPNNPVGTAWIGLDRPGYGIHGTPHPEDVGRTESHGCFRLANWNAEHLMKLAWVGMPVEVVR